MTTDTKNKTIEDIPAEHREAVLALVTSGVTAGKAEVQTEFTKYKDEHNETLGTLQTKVEKVELELAGLQDDGKKPAEGSELGTRHQQVLDRRAEEKVESERTEELTALRGIALRGLQTEAKGLNIPQELIDGAKSLPDLETVIGNHKFYPAAVTDGDKKEDKPGASPAGVVTGNGTPSNPKTDTEVATALIGDVFK